MLLKLYGNLKVISIDIHGNINTKSIIHPSINILPYYFESKNKNICYFHGKQTKPLYLYNETNIDMM